MTIKQNACMLYLHILCHGFKYFGCVSKIAYFEFFDWECVVQSIFVSMRSMITWSFGLMPLIFILFQNVKINNSTWKGDKIEKST
jgi:hypothetical protein